jgi:hypothetical protein
MGPPEPDSQVRLGTGPGTGLGCKLGTGHMKGKKTPVGLRLRVHLPHQGFKIEVHGIFMSYFLRIVHFLTNVRHD